MGRDTLSSAWCYCELSTFLPLIMVSAVRYSLSNRRSHTLGLLPGSPHTDVGLCRKLHQSTDMSICFLAFGLLVWDIALLIFKCWTSGQVKTKTHFFFFKKKIFVCVCLCAYMSLCERRHAWFSQAWSSLLKAKVAGPYRQLTEALLGSGVWLLSCIVSSVC